MKGLRLTVACVLAMAFIGADKYSRSALKATPQRTEADAVTPAVKNPDRHARFMEQAKAGKCGVLFLGDSITDAFPRTGELSWKKLARFQPLDFGIGGDRTEHVLWRITHGELEGIKPKTVVIMIGTNNIGHFPSEKPEWAAAGIRKIVDVVREKQPQAKILLMGVLPRDAKDSPRRKAIEAINQIISKFDHGANVKYMDIGGKFLDVHGEIPHEIMQDGLHPTAKGYEIWVEAILPILDEIMK